MYLPSNLVESSKLNQSADLTALMIDLLFLGASAEEDRSLTSSPGLLTLTVSVYQTESGGICKPSPSLCPAHSKWHTVSPQLTFAEQTNELLHWRIRGTPPVGFSLCVYWEDAAEGVRVNRCPPQDCQLRGAHRKQTSFDFNNLLSKFSHELYVFSEMTQWLRVLASLPEDPSSILDMCSNLPVTSAPDIQHPILVCACTHRWHMYTDTHT